MSAMLKMAQAECRAAKRVWAVGDARPVESVSEEDAEIINGFVSKVSAKTSISIQSICTGRQLKAVEARQIAMWHSFKAGVLKSDLAKFFNLHRSTAWHGISRGEVLCKGVKL